VSIAGVLKRAMHGAVHGQIIRYFGVWGCARGLAIFSYQPKQVFKDLALLFLISTGEELSTPT